MTQFERRYVAFVDILGFKSIVQRMESEPELFVAVRDVLELVDRQASELRKYRSAIELKVKSTMKRGIVPLPGVWDTRLEMTAFSDCYVLSETAPAWHVLAAVQAMGSALLEAGILTRGGVVRGRMYHDGRVLFGPAVI